jgi:NAD(P)-dependent dehydrogenase (short-subunit alcohol dehydrogenase family)
LNHPDLAGKAAIVTGAGAGIGLAVAERLAGEGCNVLCADIDGAAAHAAAAKIGSGAIGHRVDVSDEQQVMSMVEACAGAFGGVDKLVANAGIVHLASVIDTTVKDFDRVMTVNLRGTWLCTKHAVPKMNERGGGAIVNMSSLAGHIGVGGTGAYGMSKAGISHLSRITAAELRASNIRANALLPAFVDTPMQQTAIAMFDEALGEGGARAMIDRLQGRMATPEEMAGIVAFLLSDDSAMITGTTQIADGGTVAALW